MKKGAEHADRLADYTTDRRVLVLSAMALAIGAIAAAVAWALVWLIAVITNLAYFGRCLVGAASRPRRPRSAPWTRRSSRSSAASSSARWPAGARRRSAGHGIPEAIEAILIGRSRLDAKVAVLKPVSSAVSIGTGGPFGAEGPIIMTGGAFGSLFAQLFHLSVGRAQDASRRRAPPPGMSADLRLAGRRRRFSPSSSSSSSGSRAASSRWRSPRSWPRRPRVPAARRRAPSSRSRRTPTLPAAGLARRARPRRRGGARAPGC